MRYETLFTADSSNVKVGSGATREVGWDLNALRVSRAMVVVDPNLKRSEPVSAALSELERHGIRSEVFDDVRIEPTDSSLRAAIAFATEGRFDGYLAIGGGSTIDTAKAANLYATYPTDFLDYVNAPVGKGLAVPGPLKPMIAIPTTGGTGSELSGVIAFGLADRHVKTGMGHSFIRPHLGIIDPDNTRTCPPMVAACSGIDVLLSALEPLTALPFNKRESSENPGRRPLYQGANPFSYIWQMRAVETCARFLVRAVQDSGDDEARTGMLLASTYCAMGSNAGCTLPHAMSYPISELVRGFSPGNGYPEDHAIIPHGMSVALAAPAALRFMGPSNPDLFLQASALMGLDTSDVAPDEGGELLAQGVVEIMRKTGMPNGLSAVGYGVNDIDKLVEGTLPQQRLISVSPRAASAEQFREMFLQSMTIW